MDFSGHCPRHVIANVSNRVTGADGILIRRRRTLTFLLVFPQTHPLSLSPLSVYFNVSPSIYVSIWLYICVCAFAVSKALSLSHALSVFLSSISLSRRKRRKDSNSLKKLLSLSLHNHFRKINPPFPSLSCAHPLPLSLSLVSASLFLSSLCLVSIYRRQLMTRSPLIWKLKRRRRRSGEG